MAGLVMKERDLFLVASPTGDIAAEGEAHGLYYRDTRYLSRLTLRVMGEEPHPLSASAAANYQMRFFYQSARAAQTSFDQGRPGSLGVERRRVIDAGVLYEQVQVTNYGLHPGRVEIELGFGADFRDLFEARGAVRPGHGTLLEAEVAASQVVLGYRGLDRIVRRTQVTATPVPSVLTADSAGWTLTLQPGETATVALACAPDREGCFPTAIGFDAALANLQRSYGRWAENTTTVETDNPLWNRTLARSSIDLRALLTDLGQGDFPVAGIPWFAVPFGRDSIITALQALPLNPALAVGTLRTLAALQGGEVNAFRQEEPGKIIHEKRAGEMANLGEIPFLRYYGTADATPLFLVLLGETYRWTGDLALVAELLPHVKAAIGWCRQYGDRDGDGFIEYHADENGLGVQSWKDSSDSMSHRNGEWARSPIAVSEVQGYLYDAYVKMAPVLRRLAAAGHGADLAGLAAELEADAERLCARFDAAFWMPDRGYYAIALDGQKEQVGTVASDPGHCLWSGIVPAARRQAVADWLMGEELFSGWGIRTLGRAEITYNPMSYHNGSVWPHDNALIALGLKRAGFDQHVARLAEALFAVASYFPYNRLPELFCGHAATEGDPVNYPVACSPQAWAAGAPFMLIQSILGMEPDAEQGLLRLKPQLPAAVGRINLRGLRVGDAVVDLEVTRAGVQQTLRSGHLQIVVH